MVQTTTAATAAPKNPTAIFDTAISDAERLLELFDNLSKPEQQANEVLQRASLVMTLTARETFIESCRRAPTSLRWATEKHGFENALSQQKFNFRVHPQINQIQFPIGVRIQKIT